MGEPKTFRCGFVALVGRPNVGKSTLLNHLLGQKISITSRKPQTTRHSLLGIKTTGDTQFVYVDTPGLHLKEKKAMNRYMNRAAAAVLSDVDAVVFVIEAGRWTEEDDNVLHRLKTLGVPVVLAVNKVDRLKDKAALLPLLDELSHKMMFAEIVPLSALKGDNAERLQQTVRELLPLSQPLFPEDQITDRTERFLAAELVREKLMRRLGQELPYALTVEIEQFKERGEMLEIAALVWVEREGQKKIIIGKGGSGLREVGREARIEMERLFDRKVFLQIWVKVKEGWSNDERALRSLGYTDET